MQTHQTTRMLNLARGLFFLNTAVWLFFGMLGFMRAMTGVDGGRLLHSWLMDVNAAMFLLIAGAWDLPASRPSPAVPFLRGLTGALLVSSLAGLVGPTRAQGDSALVRKYP